MGFTLTTTEELGIPRILFWTAGAASLICYDQYPILIQKGLMPLKGTTSYILNINNLQYYTYFIRKIVVLEILLYSLNI